MNAISFTVFKNDQECLQIRGLCRTLLPETRILHIDLTTEEAFPLKREMAIFATLMQVLFSFSSFRSALVLNAVTYGTFQTTRLVTTTSFHIYFLLLYAKFAVVLDFYCLIKYCCPYASLLHREGKRCPGFWHPLQNCRPHLSPRVPPTSVH